MPKKTLQGWYNSGDIDYSQKEIIKKFGVEDYYPECEQKDFKKIWYWNEILERNVNELITEDIHQITFFSTWWNNNLILIIDGEKNNYTIKLIVYEMSYRKNGEVKMREVFEVFFVDWICPGDLFEAKEKSKRAEERLRSDNPILYDASKPKLTIQYFDNYNNHWVFPVIYGIMGEEVKRTVSSPQLLIWGPEFYSVKDNPDDYFKPLDIVKIFIPSRYDSNREGTRHTGIYLGNRQVCHLFMVDRATKKFEVMIEDWGELFEVFKEPDKVNKIIRYHPVIPFKHKDKIIEHIAKSITKTGGYYSRQSKAPSTSSEYNSKYNIENNNCEHMVNKCVLGLDFSELAETEKYKNSLY